MKKLLTSLMIVVLALGLMGMGAFAWFSDREESQANTFEAGTLNMNIADSDEGWNNGEPVTASWQSPTNWAPGETITTDNIRLKNVGNIDINFLFTTFYDYSYEGADLANVIEVVEYREYVPGDGWTQNVGDQDGQNLEELVGDGQAPLTLKELIEADWDEDTTWIGYATGSGYDTVEAPAIAVDGTYEVYLTLEFMEDAGNEYQGASCSFDVRFDGVQDSEQAY